MELRQLRYFVAVADDHSFTRAAQRIMIAQPSLSQQIKALERELGGSLFIRDRRGVALTAVGRALLPAARRTIDAADQAREIARLAVDEAAAALRIGFPATATPPIIADIVTAYRGSRLRGSVEMIPSTTRENLAALREGQLHAAFLFLPATFSIDSSLAGSVLGSEEIVALVPEGHPMARLNPMPSARLKSERLVVFRRTLNPDAYAYTMAQLGTLLGREPIIAGDAPTLEAMFEAVAAGDGLGLCAFSQGLLAGGRHLAMIRMTPTFSLDVRLVWRRDNVLRTLTGFVRCAEQVAADERAAAG